jgi:hypothetical protein
MTRRDVAAVVGGFILAVEVAEHIISVQFTYIYVGNVYLQLFYPFPCIRGGGKGWMALLGFG